MRGEPGDVLAAAAVAKYVVRAGRLDGASALYTRLGRSGVPDARLLARLSRADVVLAAANSEEAERCYRCLLRDAQRAGYEVVATDARPQVSG